MLMRISSSWIRQWSNFCKFFIVHCQLIGQGKINLISGWSDNRNFCANLLFSEKLNYNILKRFRDTCQALEIFHSSERKYQRPLSLKYSFLHLDPVKLLASASGTKWLKKCKILPIFLYSIKFISLQSSFFQSVNSIFDYWYLHLSILTSISSF